jgi:F-type H+-transporting ATPase subunit gamma
VIFGSDQGLVGQFNDVVVDAAVEALASEPGRPRVWVVGERARVCLAEAGITAEESFPAPNSIEAVAPLVRRLLLQSEGLHAEGALTELHLHHNRPTSGSGYAPVTQRLLPLDAPWSRRLLDAQWPTNKLAQVLGDREATLRSLVHEFLFISLFRACTESPASENASRLAAMERADRNIAELLERLEVSLHRRRQAGIDEELFDVVSGFQALADRRAEPPLPSTRASASLDPRPRPCSPTRARHDR